MAEQAVSSVIPVAKAIGAARESGPVRVMMYTDVFAPMIVNYAMLLSRGLAQWNKSDGQREVDLTVVTQMPRGTFDDSTLPYRVVRQPSSRKLWKLIREADVVHLSGPCFLPMLFALIQKTPVAIEHHGYQAVCPTGMFLEMPAASFCPGHFQARRLQKCVRCVAATEGWARGVWNTLICLPRQWMCSRVNANICITDHVRRRIGVPRAEVIYYGIEDPLPSGTTPRAAWNGAGALCIGYAGRFVPEKGVRILIRAAKELKDRGCKFRLKLIGDGFERETLEALVTELGLKEFVVFTGIKHGPDLEKEVEDVAVMVMPSMCEETAGLTAIEQMMRGRPVVASDIGGLTEVVGSAGLKYPPGDVKALADCLQQFIVNPELLTELGKKARIRAVETFGYQRMIGQHVHAYEALIGRGANHE